MSIHSIEPGLLLAAPRLGDPNFEGTVVLLGAHEDGGSIGWTINGDRLAEGADIVRATGLVAAGATPSSVPRRRARERERREREHRAGRHLIAGRRRSSARMSTRNTSTATIRSAIPRCAPGDSTLSPARERTSAFASASIQRGSPAVRPS